MENSLVPGDYVGRGRHVVALLAKDRVLLSNGFIVSSALLKSEWVATEFILSGDAFRALENLKLTAPELEDLHVGDGLLLIWNMLAMVTVVAVVDRERRLVFTADGTMVPLGDAYVAKSGWRTEETDLLTKIGQVELNSFYPD